MLNTYFLLFWGVITKCQPVCFTFGVKTGRGRDGVRRKFTGLRFCGVIPECGLLLKGELKHGTLMTVFLAQSSAYLRLLHL